jgi:hypothetical protein
VEVTSTSLLVQVQLILLAVGLLQAKRRMTLVSLWSQQRDLLQMSLLAFVAVGEVVLEFPLSLL